MGLKLFRAFRPTSTPLPLAGVLVFGGVVTKQIAAPKAGVLTLGGGVGKQIAALKAGSLALAGVVVKQAQTALAGSLTLAGTLARSVQRTLAGPLGPTGAVVKSVLAGLAGVLSPTGAVNIGMASLRSFAGALTLAGTAVKQIAATKAGTLAPMGEVGDPYVQAVLADAPVGYWRLGESVAACGYAQSEQMTDPGFESGVGSPWSFDRKTAATIPGSITSYATDAHGGAKSAQIQNAQHATDPTLAIALWQSVSAVSGRVYRVSCWARQIDCPTTPFFSSNDTVYFTTISGGGNFTGIGVDAWRYYEWVVQAKSTRSLAWYVRTHSAPTQGTFLVDDLSVMQLAGSEGAAVDASASPHDGTYAGGVMLEQTGALADGNTAALFDGLTAKISTAAFDPVGGLAACSWEAWVNGNGNAWGANATAFYNGSSGNYISLQNAGIEVGVNTTAGTSIRNSGVAPATTGWLHIVATWASGGGIKLYINGVLNGEGTARTGTLLSASTVHIGHVEGSLLLKGFIDEVAIYGTALSAEQVAAHYRAAPALGWTVAKPLVGTIPPTGTLSRSVLTTWAGALVLTGTATLSRLYQLAASGVLVLTGALTRATGTTLAGTLPATGTLQKGVGMVLAGVLAPLGALRKALAKAWAGVLALTGRVESARGVPTYIDLVGEWTSTLDAQGTYAPAIDVVGECSSVVDVTVERI